MIAVFHDEGTLMVWMDEFSRRMPDQIQDVARRKLRMLHDSQSSEDCAFRRTIGWRCCKAGVPDNGASASMTNGACAFYGTKDGPVALKSATITGE